MSKHHPKNIFIACHPSNLDCDIAARLAKTATIPRFTHRFLTRYPDHVVCKADVAYSKPFFTTTFRIPESDDEHFYERGLVDTANSTSITAGPPNSFSLPDNVLKNIYHDSAVNILKNGQENAA